MQADHFKQSFNSKLVRLEEKHKRHVRLPDAEFQFQTGSIKSKAVADKAKVESFQFQTGSIKSRWKRLSLPDWESFNSKLVRLKGGCDL